MVDGMIVSSSGDWAFVVMGWRWRLLIVDGIDGKVDEECRQMSDRWFK
jgi:hypothetical protein